MLYIRPIYCINPRPISTKHDNASIYFPITMQAIALEKLVAAVSIKSGRLLTLLDPQPCFSRPFLPALLLLATPATSLAAGAFASSSALTFFSFFLWLPKKARINMDVASLRKASYSYHVRKTFFSLTAVPAPFQHPPEVPERTVNLSTTNKKCTMQYVITTKIHAIQKECAV